MVYIIEMFTRPEEIKLRKKLKNDIQKHTKNNLELNLNINIWPKSVKISNYRHWTPIKKFRQYRLWAERNNMELYPAFKRKIIENSYTDKKYEEIVFPTISIAIYKNNNLKLLFPISETSKENPIHYKVVDLINSLKGDIPPKLKNTVIEEIKKENDNEKPKTKK